MRIVLLDNYDSFVYNLVDQCRVLGATTAVYRNSAPLSQVLAALEPTATEEAEGIRPLLCVSPGPGHPRTAGTLMALTEAALRRGIPFLGICLGFQGLVEQCGGSITRIEPVHGQADRIYLTAAGRQEPGFVSLACSHLDVARYHSLGTRRLPDSLVPLAHTGDDVVMAAKHHTQPAIGLQFHPESLLTGQGPALLTALIGVLTGAMNNARRRT
ncbi:anthranilate synthase component II [Stomatohabitans albus]|uniref:anthranilate synthase component II n=1 Tax=Stomatohabitans albus TaxID=3110766 RepID=UPI00300C8E80